MSDTTCEVYDSQSLFCIQPSISSPDLKITSFSNRHQPDQCFASNISSSPNILKQISITCAQRQFCNCAFQVLKSQCIRCTNGPLSDLWHIASINLAQYHMQGIFENVATMNLFHRTPFTKETIFVILIVILVSIVAFQPKSFELLNLICETHRHLNEYGCESFVL